MNEQNIIPTNLRPAWKVKEMGRKGGQTRSVKKRLAAKLRSLKKHGCKSEHVQELLLIMDDEELSSMDILAYTKELLQIGVKKENPKVLNMALSRYIDWHKLHFKVGSQNIAVSVGTETNFPPVINIVNPNTSDVEKEISTPIQDSKTTFSDIQ